MTVLDARRALIDGLGDARERIATGDGPQHSELVAVDTTITGGIEVFTEATSPDPTTSEMLAFYDDIDGRLTRFVEATVAAFVARDTWEARGGNGLNPVGYYNRRDWAAASDALTALRTARANATGTLGTDDDFQMYTPKGNAAVKEQVDLLAALIASGTHRPSVIIDAIRTAVKTVADKHAEIYDGEPEWAIVDTLNPLLKRAGYRTIIRDDLD